MAEIVNLNRVRKRRRRNAKLVRAKERRIRDRDRPGAEDARVRREHDGKRLDPS